jgi:hypothetical protein
MTVTSGGDSAVGNQTSEVRNQTSVVEIYLRLVSKIKPAGKTYWLGSRAFTSFAASLPAKYLPKSQQMYFPEFSSPSVWLVVCRFALVIELVASVSALHMRSAICCFNAYHLTFRTRWVSPWLKSNHNVAELTESPNTKHNSAKFKNRETAFWWKWVSKYERLTDIMATIERPGNKIWLRTRRKLLERAKRRSGPACCTQRKDVSTVLYL